MISGGLIVNQQQSQLTARQGTSMWWTCILMAAVSLAWLVAGSPTPARAMAASLTQGRAASASPLSTQEQSRRAYGQLPLSFEVNRGQFDPRVRFVARGHGYTLFLTDTQMVLTLRAG